MDDTPINSQNNNDLEVITNEGYNYKKKYIITLASLIIITIIFSIIIVILIASRKNDSDETRIWKELPNSEVLENVNCINNEKDMHSKFSQNLWNTPKRGDKRWKEGFQDMNALVGYPQLKYSSDLKKCTVTVFTKTAINLNLKFLFDNVEQKSNIKEFDSSIQKNS